MSVVTVGGTDGTETAEVAAALAARLGWQWCSLEDLHSACTEVLRQTGDAAAMDDVQLVTNGSTARGLPTFRGREIDGLSAQNGNHLVSLEKDPRARAAVAAAVRRFAGSYDVVVEGNEADQVFPRAALRLHLWSAQPGSRRRQASLRLGMLAWNSSSFDDTISRLHDRVVSATGRQRWSISVVMPARCSAENLRVVLPRLTVAAAVCDADVQIVVVDDGSTDRTGAVATANGAQVVSLATSRGIAGARNAGLHAATGDIVVFLDSDMLVEPDFFIEHLRLHQAANDVVVLGGRRHLPPGVIDPAVAGQLSRDSREALLDLYSYNLACLTHPWSLTYGCNFSVERRLLDRAASDGFDESFTGWGLEDQEFAFRLARHGARWAYSRGASAAHIHHDRTMTAERFAGWQANLRRFAAKHAGAAALEHLVPGMDPSRAADYSECYRRFDGGPTTAEAIDPQIIRVHTTNDTLPVLPDDGTDVVMVDEGGRSELAVLAEAAAPGQGVRLYTGDDWDRLSALSPCER